MRPMTPQSCANREGATARSASGSSWLHHLQSVRGPTLRPRGVVEVPRKLCATDPMMFRTPLFLADTQTPSSCSTTDSRHAEADRGRTQRRLRARVSGSSSKSLCSFDSALMLRSLRISYVRRWFCGRLFPLFGGRLPYRRCSVRPPFPWAVGYRRKSVAGGGYRPLGRSRPPPPKG